MPAIRPATDDDAMAIAGVHVRSWQVAYRGLLPDSDLDALTPEARAAHYTFATDQPNRQATVVALEGGVICGFTSVGLARDADVPGAGEVYALYVDPPQWGAGVGRHLMAEARALLAGLPSGLAVLWVLRGNERAARFYRRDGWAQDGTDRREDHWGVTTHEVRYRRPLP